MGIFLKPKKAIASDKAPFLRGWGITWSVVYSALFVSLIVQSPIFLLWTIIGGYLAGWVFAWLMWGLFFEPYVEMREKPKRAG